MSNETPETPDEEIPAGDAADDDDAADDTDDEEPA